jgi:MFS family permease
VGGALAGPALGALAAEIGTEVVFSSVLLAALALSLLATRLPQPGMPERQELREVGAALVRRQNVQAAIFVTAPSLMFGAVEVLVPLRIDELGGNHSVIAAGFIAGAALEAVLAPLAGRYSDRAGRRLPFVLGMAICAAAMVGVATVQTLGLEVAMVIGTSLGAGICFAPALTTLSEAAEETDLHQGFAAGVSNMAWATGQVLGSFVGGAAAGAFGNAPPSFAVSALLLATAAYAARVLATLPSGRPRVA